MTPARTLIRRARAEQDIAEAIDWYFQQSAPQAARGFIDELEKAFSSLAAQPAIGSPRYATALNLPGLRVWPVPRYPYLICYREDGQVIDIWRILHSQQDIPSWLHDPDSPGSAT